MIIIIIEPVVNLKEQVDLPMLSENDRTKGCDFQRQQVSSPIRIDSRQLFQETRQIIIEHEGEDYCLRVTRQNKLILTK